MKLKNIISMVCFLFLAVSCSMEDDAVMNDLESQLKKEDVSEGSVFLSFNIGSDEVNTRSTDEITYSETPGQRINSCSMILYRGNEILYVRDGLKRMTSQINGNTNVPFPEGTVVDALSMEANQIQVLTKKREGLFVMIVANATLTLNDRSNYPDMQAINSAIEDLSEKKLDGTDLLKVGTAEVTFDDKVSNPKFEASAGTAVIDNETTTNIYVQKVTVKQRAAAIRLRKFEVEWIAGTKAPVRITKVELLNSNHKVHLDGSQYEGTDAYKTLSYSIPDGGLIVYDKVSGEFKNKSFLPFTQFSFPNIKAENRKNEKYVTMKIYYTVGGFSYDSEFIINRPGTDKEGGTEYVHANYIYYLDIKAKITNHNVSCDLVCYTQDWRPNDITGTLTR